MSGEKVKVLSNLLTEIEECIPFKDKRNSNISKSDVGWQLDHTLKVINAVSGVLIKTNPVELTILDNTHSDIPQPLSPTINS